MADDKTNSSPRVVVTSVLARLEEKEKILNANRDLIVKHLDAEDILDQLIQEGLMGRDAAQRMQLLGTSDVDKNRIIVKQLTTAGPGALEKFREILRANRRQSFLADQLERGYYSTTTKPTSKSATMKCLIDVTVINRVQTRYLRQLPTSKTGWPKHHVIQYVRLALVEKEDITLKDENLNKITQLTLQGEVDTILKRKKPLSDLRDIFHYQEQPCPRLILIMGGPGIGKTTLANEICVRWAREKFLTKDFDIVILIPLRSLQQRSLEETMMEHIGEEAFEQLKKSGGFRCLIILEGLDELAPERQILDSFFVRLVKNCTVLEEATVLITSRPHACEKLDCGRRIEVVGFGEEEIKEFLQKYFSNDPQCANEFLQQLKDYPHIYSLCYVPMNLVMIADIFQVNQRRLPSTLTKVYQLFIVMTLQRQIRKHNDEGAVSSLAVEEAATNVPPESVEIFLRMLEGIPRETVVTVYLLSKLAYCAFFDWYSNREEKMGMFKKKWKDPKIIFTVKDLLHCGIEVKTADWDGYGLLKATHIHQLPADTCTYNFAHLTIQEFLCALYISTLPQQKQPAVFKGYFHEYPNPFIYLCGLTKLSSHTIYQHVYSKLSSGSTDVVTAAKCIYESQKTGSLWSALPFTLSMNNRNLVPYECLCVSYVLSSYPVSQLSMRCCHIGDKGAKLLMKYFNKNSTGQLLQVLNVSLNYLTIDGFTHIMRIVSKSSTSLRVLDVGQNNIGDAGMPLILEGLQHSKSLAKLRVDQCKLSAKSARCISDILMRIDSLQVLELGWNNIGDDGIAAIAGALSTSKISELDVCKCSIALSGAKSLGSAIQNHHTIRKVLVRDNPITVEGAHLILCSALVSKVCQYVSINDEYERDNEVKKLVASLEHRRKFEEQREPKAE